MRNRIVGIDLGTTYSCIAQIDGRGKPMVLQNAEGDATTPSVVYFESADNIVVGQAAKEVASIHTDLCVSTVKRSMGDPSWERTFYGHAYTPQDISSFILRKLVGDAEKITGDKIEDVVITCPAYFGINEKEATKQAGIVAGLNVLYVIPEPMAAALAYGIEQTEDQVILVYDLGGGTFDVTLIEIKGGEVTVICTGGDHQLGGKDWDDAIVSYFVEKFSEATGTPADALLEDAETYQELLNAAERCKKMLSSRQSVTEAVRFGGERVKVDLTREIFDQITAQYLERTLSLTDQELEKARRKGYNRIDKLLLVGGSTYMPQVIDSVKKRFPFEVRQFDPNQAVAKGAAIFGYKCYCDGYIRVSAIGSADRSLKRAELGKSTSKFALPPAKKVTRQVSPKSFGIVVLDPMGHETVLNLIRIGDPVPLSVARQMSTLEAGQNDVEICCMENSAQDSQVEISECREIGKIVLGFGRPLPKNSSIDLIFGFDPDGLLSVSAKVVETGWESRAEFRIAATSGK
jgi:molecular chaperone DnaK